MKRWPLIVVVLTSCTTFSDLESEHPFDGECEPGFVLNEAGECIPEATNNVSNTPNNTSNTPNNQSNSSNNSDDCPLAPGRCCSQDGADYCCTDDGCCYTDPAECEPQPPNNPLLNQHMLVIRDADPQACLDLNGDGPDIFGVRLVINNSDAIPYLVGFEPGPGVQTSEDQVDAVLQQVTPDTGQGCPQGPSFSLGCGGGVSIGFQSNEPFDITTPGHVTVLESGPPCDQAQDRYRLEVCPMNDPNNPNNCFVLGDAYEGNVDQDFQF